MSQQAEGVLITGDVLDNLVRSKVIVSKDGYSCDGTDLFAFPNSDDNINTGLNDELNTEAKIDNNLSVLGQAETFLKKNNDGTFTIPIQAPSNSDTNPLETFGFRLSEVSTTPYQPPLIPVSDWSVGQQALMIDGDFDTFGSITVDSGEISETIFDFSTSILRNIFFKIESTGTGNLSYDISGSDTNTPAAFVTIIDNTTTSGTIVNESLSSSFRFYRIQMIVTSDTPFSVTHQIYNVTQFTSPSVPDSTWPIGQQPLMVDGAFDTFGTISGNTPGSVRNSTVFDFGSVATRDLVTITENTLSNNYRRLRFTTSDDNVNFDFLVSPPTDSIVINPGDDDTEDVTVDNDNFIYRIDDTADTVIKYTNGGSQVTSWSVPDQPKSITHDSSNNIYVGVLGTGTVYKFSSTGTSLTNWISAAGTIDGIEASASDEIYAHNTSTNRVYRTDDVGVAINDFSVGSAISLALDSSDNVYVIDTATEFVEKRSNTGTLITSWSTTSELGTSANAIAIDSSDLVYVGGSVGEIAVYTDTGTLVDNFTPSSASGFSVKNMAVATTVDDDVYSVTGTAGVNRFSIVRISYNTSVSSGIINSVLDSFPNRYLGVDMISFSTGTQTPDQNIYEVYEVVQNPTVVSSNWLTTSDMVDNDPATSDSLVVEGEGGGEKETIFDFESIALRNMHTLIETNTIDGTPVYSFELAVSDLVGGPYVVIDSGSLTSGVKTDATNNTDTSFRFARIRINDTLGLPFKADFDIFEGYDSNVLNDLTFSTVVIGGSTNQDNTVDQTDPITLEVSDGQIIFHPPRYFRIDQSKYLTAQITSLKTAHEIEIVRGMTWQRNFTSP